MFRPPKVATPADAAAVVVPARDAPDGPPARLIVMIPLKPDATLPKASRAVTVTAGENAAPATAEAGDAVKTRSVTPVPALSSVRPPNVATPRTAAALVVPPSAAPAGFAPNAIATVPVKLASVLPAASC